MINLFSKESRKKRKLKKLRDMLQDQDIRSTVQMIENEDGLVVGYTTVYGTDQDYFSSSPHIFDWPLQHMPVPDIFRQTNMVN